MKGQTNDQSRGYQYYFPFPQRHKKGENLLFKIGLLNEVVPNSRWSEGEVSLYVYIKCVRMETDGAG